MKALHQTLTNSIPVTDVYRKISEDILKDHPDLTLEFLWFLTPYQAMALDKYSEYCQQQALLDVLHQLQILSLKQPSLFQKILKRLAFYHAHFSEIVEQEKLKTGSDSETNSRKTTNDVVEIESKSGQNI